MRRWGAACSASTFLKRLRVFATRLFPKPMKIKPVFPSANLNARMDAEKGASSPQPSPPKEEREPRCCCWAKESPIPSPECGRPRPQRYPQLLNRGKIQPAATYEACCGRGRPHSGDGVVRSDLTRRQFLGKAAKGMTLGALFAGLPKGWVGSAFASDAPETSKMRFGMIALTDCSPIVIAHEKGFFKKYGIESTVAKGANWAAIRDSLSSGA